MASWLRVGNIRGPQGPIGPAGPPGPSGAAGEGFVGEIRSVLLTTPPSGWLLLNGQTVANANLNYPELWALPMVATWRSGTSLVLPNMGDRTLFGLTAGAAGGTLSGANSRAIPLGALPSHTHPMPHTHEHVHTHTIAHTHTMAHVHSIVHNHPAGTTGAAGAHAHKLVYYTVMKFGTGNLGLPAGGAGQPLNTFGNTTDATDTEAAHTHSVDLPSYTGNSGASSAASTGAASAASSGGASDATSGQPSVSATTASGSGAAMDMTPANLRVNWMIKAVV